MPLKSISNQNLVIEIAIEISPTSIFLHLDLQYLILRISAPRASHLCCCVIVLTLCCRWCLSFQLPSPSSSFCIQCRSLTIMGASLLRSQDKTQRQTPFYCWSLVMHEI